MILTELPRLLFEGMALAGYAVGAREGILYLRIEYAYLKAYRSWDRYDGADVRAWLYTIALRLAFNELRGRRRWLAAMARIERKSWRDPSDPDLWAALETLDVRTRSALLLNIVDGYTQVEIGRILAAPEGTVASWISRGRAALRRELEPER